MKLTFAKAVEIIQNEIGEDCVPVVKYLKDKKNISEFKIAEKTAMNIQQIRNVLYRLQNNNLITYYKKKDRVKGWYISYWTLSLKGLKHVLEMKRRQELENLSERLIKEEGNTFYICPNMCMRLSFESATDISFKCTECGQILKEQDNAKTIDHIKERIKEISVKAAV